MKRTLLYLLVFTFIFSTSAIAQNSGKKITITGIVTDINNQPIANAVILVDTKNTGIMTDINGLYKIKVKPGASRISVLTLTGGQAEEEIAGRTDIDIQLGVVKSAGTKAQTEEELVNIGYGNTTKDDMTTSTRKIKSNKDKNATYSTIYEMLRADPSVQVSGSNVVIRGVGSNSSTVPLFLVDGVVVPSLDNVSPQLVKSIEILKGADATIYGARGANGVILVTLIGKD